MVVIISRGAKNSHQPITQHLIDRPTIRSNCIEHQCKVIIQEFNHLGRCGFFTQRGERADIREHDRGVHIFTAKGKTITQQLFRHLVCDKSAKELALFIPQAFLFETGIDPCPQ